MTARKEAEALARRICPYPNCAGCPEVIERALLAAEARGREQAARVAEEAERRHQRCPPACRCSDGYHVAAAIRALGSTDSGGET